VLGTAIDYEAIKKNQRAGWETGDYPRVGNTLQIIAEELVAATGVRAGQRVLDVACGQGNAALAAARRFAAATGSDYAVNLLAQGRERAAAEHLPVTFIEGDAEQLPFPDDSFDTTLSTVGVMFAPNHQRAADELVRVTAPGGRIGLASWTAEGFVGRLLKTVSAHVPPPPVALPPTRWGSEEVVRELLGEAVEDVESHTAPAVIRFPSAEAFTSFFLTNYGPTYTAAQKLDDAGRAQLRTDILALAHEANRATDGTFVGVWEYRVVTAVRTRS